MTIDLIPDINATESVAHSLPGITRFADAQEQHLEEYFSENLRLLAAICGWIYFLSWTAAFYPQIIDNILRRSVIGLNLDFVALNFPGHLTYAIFNAGLFWIPQLQAEYYKLHPTGVIPVQLNDVLFSLHAVGAVTCWIVQASVYDRGDQSVSLVCIFLLLLIATYMLSWLVATVVGSVTWLTFVYYISYVKLFASVTKYSPQVYFNYKRKSTNGFNMGGVLLDLIGGAFSIIQMVLIAYNYNDWGSITGDPTKLGLGMISMTYNVVFIIQSYLLYKNSYEPIESSDKCHKRDCCIHAAINKA